MVAKRTSKMQLIKQKRDKHLENFNKWDNFRENRAKIIDRYIKLRKKQTMVSSISKKFKV